MKKLNLSLLLMMMLVYRNPLLAQVDTVTYYNHILLPKHLQPGRTKYLVYSEDSLTKLKSGISIWERTISTRKINNREVLFVYQVWKGLDTINSKREVLSQMDAATFSPLYHLTLFTASHVRKRENAFVFKKDSIIVTDLASADNKTSAIALQQPVFNWELDMETFAQLPLKTGKTFVIPFYHPGSKVLPALYTYKVEGEEQLEGLQNHLMKCWRLVHREESSANYSIWWISKATHTVIKMKEYYNGKFRYKLMMNV